MILSECIICMCLLEKVFFLRIAIENIYVPQRDTMLLSDCFVSDLFNIVVQCSYDIFIYASHVLHLKVANLDMLILTNVLHTCNQYLIKQLEKTFDQNPKILNIYIFSNFCVHHQPFFQYIG